MPRIRSIAVVVVVVVLGIYAASLYFRVHKLERVAPEEVEKLLFRVAAPWNAAEIRAVASPAMFDLEGQTIEKKAELVSDSLGSLLAVKSTKCELSAVTWKYAKKRQVMAECDVKAIFEKAPDDEEGMLVIAVKVESEWKLAVYAFHEVEYVYEEPNK